MRALVTGGAGYIGSQLCHDLAAVGDEIIVLDNFSTGYRKAVPEGTLMIEADVRDVNVVNKVFRDNGIDVVFHLAALTDNAASIEEPGAYFDVNAHGTTVVADAARDNGVKGIVFASTAAVYGAPDALPVAENSPIRAKTPYGKSKFDAERYLCKLAAEGMPSIVIRFFNAGGADPLGRTGPRRLDAPNLLAALCRTVLGSGEEFCINGSDYPTPDGTCIRDFIHVADISAAYRCAASALRHNRGSDCTIMNCGYGFGYSVREIVDTAARMEGKALPVSIGPRRQGDVAEIVADASTIMATLDWAPEHNNLDEIVGSTIAWFKNGRHDEE